MGWDSTSLEASKGNHVTVVECKSKSAVTYTLKNLTSTAHTHISGGVVGAFYTDRFSSLDVGERILNCKVRSCDGTDLLPKAGFILLGILALMRQLRVKRGYYFSSFK